MVLPRWIPFVVAAWVIAFGILRLRIASKKEDEDSTRPNYRKGGYYAKSKRSHAIFGVAYIVLGLYCLSMGLGYHIDVTGGCLDQKATQEKAGGNAVGDDGIPVTTEE